MKIGKANVDFDELTISSPAGHFAMESKVMSVLWELHKYSGTVVTREQLIDRVWGVGFGTDERLSRSISTLRKAFGDIRGNHYHIKTVPKKGYKLIKSAPHAPVSEKQSTPPKPQPIPVPIEALDPAPSPNRFFNLRSLSVIGLILAALLWFASGTSSLFPARQTPADISYNSVAKGLGLVENFTEKNAIQEAQILFSQALTETPEQAAAHAGYALALMRHYTYVETDPSLLTRASASSAAAMKHDSFLALSNIASGWAAEYQGELPKALEFYNRADNLDPDHKFTLEGRIRTLSKQGHYEQALELTDFASTLYPNYALFYSISGQLLTKSNNYSLAEQKFRHSILLAESNPNSYAQLAQTLHLQNRTQEAIQVIQKGLERNKASLLYNNLGTYLFFVGQYDLAAEAFKENLGLEGNSHNYLYWANLGDAYRHAPNGQDDAATAYSRALQLMEPHLEKHPSHNVLNSRAALFHAKLGNVEKSQQHLLKIKESSNAPSIEHYRAAVIHEIFADRPGALTSLEKALKAGYPLIEIMHDPELSALREDQGYHKILTRRTKKNEE
ncbi:MAG: winged helix-turn-helix domain-containing protein [Hellea sp.]